MSEMQTEVMVPEWDLADRMRKALRISGMDVQEMADYLGVARNTVSTWINGRNRPSRPTLRLWAMRCGVPYEWLLEEGLMFDKTSAGHPCVGPHFRTVRGRMICQCACSRCGFSADGCICPGCQCREPEDHDDALELCRSGLGLAA